MLKKQAMENMQQKLQNNPYPGRGIVVGKNDTGLWVQVYWIMGRSENSRNRIFVLEKGILKTQAADASKVTDPTLIIYNAMRDIQNHFIVTNGCQTDTIHDSITQGKSFAHALSRHKHEPDAPNFTPRISGCLAWKPDDGLVMLSVLKASPFDNDSSEYLYFHYPCVAARFGYAVTTYKDDGNPIPSFEGEPYLLPLEGDIQAIADCYWQTLNEDNKVSLAVRGIDPKTAKFDTVIVNKHTSIS